MNTFEIESLVNEYGSMVSNISRRMISNPDIAAEAAQESWFEILKSFDTFKGNSSLKTWIYSITSRTVLKYAKNEKQYTTDFLSRIFTEREAFSQPEDIEKKEWVKDMCDKCLTGILHCLDNSERLLYILREVTELSYRELADIFGKAEAALRKTFSRLKDKLGNFIHDHCVLSNPGGKCRCRMKEHVVDIDLPGEYDKIRNTAKKVFLYKESMDILPKINYWQQFL